VAARAAITAEGAIPWDQAEEHVGETATVEGRVLGIHCSPTSCLLAFDPTFNRFTAVVQAKDFKSLSPEKLNADYVGRNVRVTGKIEILEKKPEIVISRPEDLAVVTSPQERAQKREEAANEVVDRLDEILDRLDELVVRLDETQARLDQVATALDEQGATIAQIAAIQAEAIGQSFEVPQPSYGEPQPRPGFEALRTLKRGMTSAEVARLAGEPLSSETLPGGNVVWDYGYGRSITFDSRNRATSLTGFPAP
jgi:hypothetical protein